MRDRLKRYARLLTKWPCNALAILSVGFLLGAGWLLALLLFGIFLFFLSLRLFNLL